MQMHTMALMSNHNIDEDQVREFHNHVKLHKHTTNDLNSPQNKRQHYPKAHDDHPPSLHPFVDAIARLYPMSAKAQVAIPFDASIGALSQSVAITLVMWRGVGATSAGDEKSAR